MPVSAFFDFHGVTAEVVSPPDDLRRDFAYFAAPARPPDVRLEVNGETGTPPPRALWRWRGARIVDRGGRRLIDYEGRALLEYDFASERGVLRCSDPSLAHELAYLAVLSRVGERLDRRGLHRVHALGFTYRGRGGLLLLPSGGGKSRLALELLRREGFGLLSDDAPLLDGSGSVAAFPLGIGLRGEDGREVPKRFVRTFLRRRFPPKGQADLDYFRVRVAPRAPLAWILAGRRNGGAPRIEPCSKAAAAAALGVNLVLGVGTPQILELMAPPPPYAPGLWTLARIAAARALCAARAVARASCARFFLGGAPSACADALTRHLQR